MVLGLALLSALQIFSLVFFFQQNIICASYFWKVFCLSAKYHSCIFLVGVWFFSQAFVLVLGVVASQPDILACMLYFTLVFCLSAKYHSCIFLVGVWFFSQAFLSFGASLLIQWFHAFSVLLLACFHVGMFFR